MRTLRIGMTGTDVAAWQNFLAGKHLRLRGDGSFGRRTFDATVAFQSANGLRPDGIVGNRTVVKARRLGFAEPNGDLAPHARRVSAPPPINVTNDFPPRPNFAPLVSNDARARVFGRFEYEVHPEPKNREAIRILGNWTRDNIVSVGIPQLQQVRGGHANVRFHRLAAMQMQRLWAAWEDAGLLDRAITWDGGFVPRLV